MGNLHTIQDSSENRKKSKSVLRGVGKGITAVALALGAQIGSLTQQPPAAQAAEPARVQMQQRVPEAPALANIEKDVIVADEAHTIKGGVSFILGAPVLVFPVQDSSNGKEYIQAFEDCTSAVPDGERRIRELSIIFGKEGLKDIWVDTPWFIANTQEQLDKVSLTDDEKRRIYYARAYFWAAMGHWKTGDGAGKIGMGSDTGETQKAFAEAAAAFKALDDGSEWFAERVKDFDVFKASALTSEFHGRIAGGRSKDYDIDDFLKRVAYTEHMQQASHIMQARTEAYLDGKKPRSEYLMDVALFQWMMKDHHTAVTLLPKKSMLADQRYRDAMATIEAILPTMQQAFTAIGAEFDNKQEARYQVVQGQLLLGYQTFLAEHGSQFPGIPSAMMAAWADQNYSVAKAALDQYGAADLGLAPEVLASLTQNRIAYAQHADKYTRLAAGADTGKRLRELFAQVLKKNSTWSTADKQQFHQIYQDAIASSSAQAMQDFTEVLQENIIVSAPRLTIARYEETGRMQTFPMNPYYREINGTPVYTTEHPVDAVHAEFEIENRTPLNVPITVVIKLPSAWQQPEITRTVQLRADQVAEVSYDGDVSITVSREGGDVTPKAQLVLNPDRVMEVASRAWGEQLASAQ